LTREVVCVLNDDLLSMVLNGLQLEVVSRSVGAIVLDLLLVTEEHVYN